VNHASWGRPFWVYTTAGGANHASWRGPLLVHTTAGGVNNGWWCRREPEVDARSEEWTLCRRMRRSKKVRECWWVAIIYDSTDRKHRGRCHEDEVAAIEL